MSSQKKATVAIVVPIYNDSLYMETCLDSILAQTADCWEVWMTDDCSTDNTVEIAERYCAKDSRFHLFRNEKNCGAWVGRARGILAASESVKYIMFSDTDDSLAPDAVATVCEEMEKDPVDILHFKTNVINCSKKSKQAIIRYSRYLDPPMTKLCGREIFDSFVERSFEGHLWNKAFNANLLKSVITDFGADRILPKAQDKVLYWAVCWYKDDLTYRGISKKLYNYCYGRGVEGGLNTLPLEDFTQYLAQAWTENAISEIMSSHPEQAEAYSQVIEKSRQSLVTHSMRNFLRLDDADKPEGMKMVSQYWNRPLDSARIVCGLAEYTWDSPVSSFSFIGKSEMFKTTKTQKDIKVVGTYYHRMDNGGIQRVIVGLMQIWHSLGYEVILFTDDEPKETDYEIPEYVTRVKIDRFFSKCNAKNYHERGMSFAKLLDEYKVDCMIYHSYFSDVLLYDMCICKSMNIPFFIYQHNVFTRFLRYDDSKFSTIAEFSRFADGIICLDEMDREWWSCFNPNVHVVLNPLTFDVSTTSPAPRDNHDILFLGRFAEAAKRPGDAIEIAEKVINRIPDARLIMVGTCDNKQYLEHLQNMIKKKGLSDHILMEGFDTDVGKYYLQSSVFLSCSTHEGFMLTLCEAMSYNVPIVMYDLPYLATTKDNPGIISVPQNEKDAAAHEICALFEDRDKLIRIGDSGRAHLDEMYNTDLSAQWTALFADINNCSCSMNSPMMQMMASTIVRDYYAGSEEAARNGRSARRTRESLEQENRNLRGQRRHLQRDIDNIKASLSFRLGRIITWLPRKIRDWLRKNNR